MGTIVGAIVSLVGLYLAHSYNRHRKMRIAELRLTAYAALWERMASASPVRLTEWIDEPLTQEERQDLFDEFTAWYYEDGNGMLVGGTTRSIYLRVKDNLRCPIESYEPAQLREELKELNDEARDRARGRLSISQLSLLRNRMKADLAVYGQTYHIELDKHDEALLEHCGEDLTLKPWGSLPPWLKPWARNAPSGGGR